MCRVTPFAAIHNVYTTLILSETTKFLVAVSAAAQIACAAYALAALKDVDRGTWLVVRGATRRAAVFYVRGAICSTLLLGGALQGADALASAFAKSRAWPYQRLEAAVAAALLNACVFYVSGDAAWDALLVVAAAHAPLASGRRWPSRCSRSRGSARRS